ncbi:MAG: DUF6268 family outer membrane beta-barrel protein [Acidiferrobacterales bacterium]
MHQFESDLAGGGQFSVTRYFLDFDAIRPLNRAQSVGLTLTYGFEDYNFAGRTALGSQQPWDRIHRFGVGVPLSFSSANRWHFLFTPSFEFARESGADWDDAFTYGVVFSAVRSVRPTLTIGVGVGVFNRLEQNVFFAFPAVNWQITQKWRLSNPFRAGPTGPAGLELVYTRSPKWAIAGGGAYRSLRFRLDDDAPVPNGIGEERALPLFGRLSRKLGHALKLDLYAGVLVEGQLSIDDPNGNEIASDDYDSAPFVALTIAGRF